MNPDEQGTPTPPDTPLYRQFLASQQAKQPSGPDTDLYRQFLAQQGPAAPQIRHDPALRARQAARGKISDQEQADATDNQPGILGSIADAAQGIPGVGAMEASARSVVRGQPYPIAYSDIKAQTDKVPTSAKIIGRMGAGAPAMAALPGSGMVSGAIYGAADQALDANPDKGLGARAGSAVAGGVAGGLLGKAGEVIGMVPRLLRSPTSGANIIARQAARGAEADALYGKALAEGQGRTNTPAINRVLQEPDNAALSSAQGELRQHAGSQPTDPERLDALYKAHSDRAKALQRGLESAIPNRPNTGTSSLIDTKLAQQDLLDAMSGGTTMPGPMPSYRPAVENYAKASGDIQALETGQDALRHSLSKGVTTGKNIDATTKEAFARWAGDRSPSQAQAASEGVVGAAKEDWLKHPLKNLIGGRAVGKAPGLLRATGNQTQTIFDMLTKLGLLGTDAARQ